MDNIIQAVGKLGIGAFLTSKSGMLLAAALASPFAVSLTVRLLNKIPLAGWFAFLEGLGRNISRLGYLKLHRPVYEPIEAWFQNFLVGSVNAINKGLDSDDGTEDAPAPAAPALKSLVLLAGLLLLPAAIRADSTQFVQALDVPQASVVEEASWFRFRAGGATFSVPFLSNLEAIGAYDVIHKKGLLGVESVVAEYKKFEGTLGVFTDADVFDGGLAGTLAVGARRQIPQWKIHVGLFIGRDFRDNVWRGGIKGSKALFGGAAD